MKKLLLITITLLASMGLQAQTWLTQNQNGVQILSSDSSRLRVIGQNGKPVKEFYTRWKVDQLLTSKQGALTVTTTGTGGPATLIANILNIPQYTGGAGTVTSVTSGNTNWITVATGTTTPVITAVVGQANTNLVQRISNGGIQFQTGGGSILGDGAQGLIYDSGTSSFGSHTLKTQGVTRLAINTAGNISISGLATGGTAPTTSGTTNYVIVDANGLLSRTTSAGGATNLALGTGTSTTQPITNSNGTGVTLPSATTSVAGLISAADKTKLDGIAAGANNYTLPLASASVLGGVKVGSGLSIDGGGVLSATSGSTPSLDLVLLAGSDGGEGSTMYVETINSLKNSTNITLSKQVWTGISAKTSTYTMGVGDDMVLADASFGSFVITLPTAASCYDSTTGTSREFTVKKTDSSANTVTIKGNGSELIDLANTLVITMQNSSATVKSNGTQFYVK
jgi:hypothetical protein